MEGSVDAERAQAGPVFVVGLVRSGTTLMSMMLSAHPAIAIAPDMHYIHRWVQRNGELQLSRPADFERFWNAFSSDERFAYIGIDAGAARQYIVDNRRCSFRGVYLSILELFAANMQKPRWGEKTPFTANHLETLFGWFPDARVIYMLRDPRAVVSSLRQIPWLADVGVRAHARSWADGVHRALSNEPDPRVFQIRYEHLVFRPTEILEEVCRFLEEPFSPDMLDGRDVLEAATLRGREGWEKDHISAALGPVHEMSVDKWQRQLTPAEIAVIEHRCGPVMDRAGYPRSVNLPPAGMRAPL